MPQSSPLVLTVSDVECPVGPAHLSNLLFSCVELLDLQKKGCLALGDKDASVLESLAVADRRKAAQAAALEFFAMTLFPPERCGRVQISSVQKYWSFLLETLKRIPVKS